MKKDTPQMLKQILLYKDAANNRAVFVKYIEHTVLPQLIATSPQTLKITITKKAPPLFRIIPFSTTAVACISITGSAVDILKRREDAHFYGAYTVDEATPISYKIDWESNTPTRGACLLTLFNRKKNIADDTFIDRWHNGHTPLSLKIHPLWNYVRNVVKQTHAGASFDGIVEEQVKEESQLLNPIIFFGGLLYMLKNMILTYFDTKSFIDYASMETYLAEETWIIHK